MIILIKLIQDVQRVGVFSLRKTVIMLEIALAFRSCVCNNYTTVLNTTTMWLAKRTELLVENARQHNQRDNLSLKIFL